MGPRSPCRPIVVRRFSGLASRPSCTIEHRTRYVSEEVPMVAVIGNVIAGLLALSLFTATVRITK